MTIEDKVLAYIRKNPDGSDDDEIAAVLGVTRQQVNQRARQLEVKGQVTRTEKRKIPNFPIAK